MKTINLANEQSHKVTREKLGKADIENLKTEILELKGEPREARMQTYRRLVAASADQLVYFTRSWSKRPHLPTEYPKGEVIPWRYLDSNSKCGTASFID